MQNDLDIGVEEEEEDEEEEEEEDTKENLTDGGTYIGPSKSSNGRTKEYKCSECQAEFVRASQLRAHERTHFEEQTYECDQCDEVFVRIGLLTTHQREQHRHNLSCKECDAKFSHYNSYKLHQRRHKGDKPHKCRDCDMAFVQQCHLNIHRRVHTGEKPYKCELCPQRFKQASHLVTHTRVHTNDKPFVCNHCEASFSQTSSLKRHKRRHTGEKPFKCDVCGALFVERRNLSRHQLTHTGEKPYKCEKCPASFTQMIDLKRHQMSHSGLKPFKCDICDAAFSRKNNLRWHKLTHEGDTPFKCDKCNVGFSLQRDMKTHMRTHSGIKPFSCDQCGATFTQFSTLKRHRLSHTGERHFVCSKCHGAFKDRSALKRHMLRHESVRPYSCHKCDSTFIEYRNLKRHRVTVHGEERFEGQDDMDARENEHGHTLPPPKKRSSRAEEDEDTLSPIYDDGFPATPLIQHQEATQQQQQHVDQPITLAPVTTLPQSQQQPHTAQTVQTNSQPPLVNEIVTIPAQAPGHLPTLLLTQPGQPPKTARPANNCQNYQSHVLTFVEGSYNHWQSWCFCETPNIPDNQQTIIDSGNNVGAQPPPSAITTATLPHQTITYTELQQPQPQPQSVAVQEVNQTDFHQPTQFSGSYSEPLHHYEDSHHGDQLDPLTTHHPHQQSQHLHQPHASQEEVKIAIDSPRLFSVANIQQNEPQGPQQQQSQPQQQHHDQHSQHSQQQQQNLQSQTDQQQDHPDPQQQGDSQVTFQYSLTVNNPATGDIQIQSEAFPANPPDPPTDPPIKKRRVTKTADSQEVKSYNCDSCSKTFSRINHLFIHQRTHTGEKPYQCGVCYQSFTHKNSLTIHMRGHTGERPYVCITCGASFTQKSNLRVHSRTHTGEKPFKCDVCALAFTQGSHLTAHKRIHNNDRPFACDNCRQSFTQRSALKRHLMTHTGHKPHKCEECNAKFSQKDDLKRHQRIHSGEKPLSCTYKFCTLLFADRTALTRHIRSVHQGKSEESIDAVKKKKKPNIKPSISEDNTSPKSSKVKPKVLVPEPTRTSKRLREAAEKKKDKPEDSDFIMGDFVEIEEDIKPTVRQKTPKKPEKVEDIKSEAKSKMESWCFCEVPHGPDEPHTHSAVDTKLRIEEPDSILPGLDDSSHHSSTNLIATADVTGATSLLQLSMEHVTHSSGISSVAEGNLEGQSIDGNVPLNNTPSIVGTSQMGEASGITESSSQQVHVTSVSQTDPSVSQSLASGQVVTAMGHPPSVAGQTTGRLVGQSMLTAGQVVSTGQLVGASQLMTQEGTIFIEAGEMLSNGTVVINPSQGTFISYDQITISPDGQVRESTFVSRGSVVHEALDPQAQASDCEESALRQDPHTYLLTVCSQEWKI
ncbi:Zinc finger protein 665 [Chionoecetes opilio]|uniref:Zinc finger protein 665 n=1 Tax=Chionoecetes opilio TaxID=41210 RepID=A0A8J4YF43_CHIOP|nr:Zinc finger protein 665 [Chionoecetes opilio]